MTPDLPHRPIDQRPLRVGVWNYYEEITRDGFLFKNAEVGVGAKLLQPWCDLYAFGQANGIDFLTLDQVRSPDELDAVIFMDRPREGRPMSPLIEALLKAPLLKYLFLYECEVIKADNWERAYHERFDRVFTWHDELVDTQRYCKLNFATDIRPAGDFEALKARFAERRLACVIAGAKTSNHPSEFYSERVRAIRWFEANAPQDLSLYGFGWDAAAHPSHRGHISDKLGTLAGYRFSICYENAKNIPGYITEKVLDCLRAGCVPVYAGAPNIGQWIASDCFIDLRQFRSYPELHAFLTSMDAATHGAYLDRIHAFLTGPHARPFSSEHFVLTVSQTLLRDAATRRQQLAAMAAPASAAAFQPDRSTQAAGTALVDGDADEIRRRSFRDAGGERLIVYFGYGDELPVFTRARALWQFFLSHFPQIKAVFARTSSALPLGEVVDNGYDLVVGIGQATASPQEPGYAASGVWSTNENRSVIYRQIAVYRHLLRTHPGPFHLLQTTVTSVIDFRGLMALLDQLPATACFAGPLGRLSSPEEVRNLTIVSGANTLLSRDVVELLLQRWDPEHAHASYPNDVWQALLLPDVPRTPLPFFGIGQPRSAASRRVHVPALIKQLLALGHYHFRVKTSSAEAGLGLREEVDPWVMASLMDAILASGPVPEANRALLQTYSDFCQGPGVPAFSATPMNAVPRRFPLNDEEAEMLFPDPTT